MTADGRLREGASTVRFRITLLATVVVATVLVITSITLVAIQARTLQRSLDDSLVQRSDDLAALVATDRIPDTLAGAGDDSLAQIVDARGTVLSASPNLAGEPAVEPAPTTTRLQTVSGVPVDDDEFRLLSRVVGSGDGAIVVHVAAATDDNSETVAALATSLAVGVPAIIAVLAALVWWLVGRTLRPVEAIRAEVAAIGGRELGRRVPETAGGDEIARLARTMNAMLERLERAAARERRFVADASHELRTPLTRIRTEVEVDLARSDSATLRSVLEDATAMQRLVEDLLQLARSDAGAIPVRTDAVDLDDVVMDHARRVRGEGRVTVDASGVSAAQVRGDRDQLARAIGNLVDNAARFATTAVTLSVGEHDSVAVVEVADDGPGIPADQRERVFERFARLDEARTVRSGGTGLGLAIARDIVERHGGKITVDDRDPSGARVVVRLPLG